MFLLKLPITRLKERVKEENKKNLVISPISEVETYHKPVAKLKLSKLDFFYVLLPLCIVLPYFKNHKTGKMPQ